MVRTITANALIKRIRRKLAHEHMTLSTNRGGPYSDTLPMYYAVNANNNICDPSGDNLEEIGRDLGVLKEGERLA